jgi:hypothetical protein
MAETPAKPSESQAVTALEAFYGAPSCDAREKLIVFPEHNRERLRSMPCSPMVVSASDSRACDALDAGGGTCRLQMTVDHVVGSAWLVRQADGTFRVDFRATELRQPTLFAFKRERPTKPVLLRAWATYVSSAVDDPHDPHKPLTLMLSEATRDLVETVYAFIASDRPDTQVLLTYFGDHQQYHPVTVLVHYPKGGRDVVIDAVIALGFFETEREHAFDADGGS